jgi:NAD(P)H-dependent FMN reductase
MSMNRDIAVLVGSLRKESFNRKMAHALIESAPVVSVNVV